MDECMDRIRQDKVCVCACVCALTRGVGCRGGL
jgi:hypothetical protein